MAKKELPSAEEDDGDDAVEVVNDNGHEEAFKCVMLSDSIVDRNESTLVWFRAGDDVALLPLAEEAVSKSKSAKYRVT